MLVQPKTFRGRDPRTVGPARMKESKMYTPKTPLFIRSFKACLAPLTLTAMTALAADSFKIVDLGRMGPFAINNQGDVVGSSSFGWPPQTHACVYHGTNGIDLGTLGGTYSQAQGINDNADVVGYSTTSNGGTHAFLYSGGTMKDLGTLDGSADVSVESHANWINALGQIVGYSSTSTGALRAFLYSGGTMTDLGSLGGSNASANCLNRKGEIVGGADTIAGASHAFLYSGGIMKDLGTLGGANSGAVSINDNGVVVGTSDTSNGAHHAYIYRDGVMTDLGALAPGVTNCFAYAINNQGQMAGAIQTNVYGGWHGILYSNGQMLDLNSLATPPRGWILGRAIAINDQGWILVGGANMFSTPHAFLLQPIAQPRLSFRTTETNLVLSWPAGSYVLETSDTVGSAATWMPLTNGIVTSGTASYLTNSAAKAIGFFRLRN